MTGEELPDGGVEGDVAVLKPAARARRRRTLALAATGAMVLAVAMIAAVNRDGEHASSVVPVATADEPEAPVYPASTTPSEADTATTTAAAVQPSAPSTTSAPARPVPQRPALTTAPHLVSMSADAAAGTVTLTFDQAVEPSSDGMNVLFFQSAECAVPSANGHAVVSGSGTPTIVLESSYRWPGTAYVQVNPGLVKGVENGLPSERVGCTEVDTGRPTSAAVVGAVIDRGADPGSGAVTVLFDRQAKNGDAAALALFDDPACQHRVGTGTTFASFAGSAQTAGLEPANGGSVVVATTSHSSGAIYVVAGAGLGLEAYGSSPSSPSTCMEAMPFSPPVLVSASGDLGAGQITLRFSRPVVGPVGNVLMAMRLVVYMGDATCASPNGNAHVYLSGLGTDTITVEATSLVAGTTYITIVPGFVRSADEGTANRAVACHALPVS